MKYNLKKHVWYDEDDPEHLIYFTIIDESKKTIWMSSWSDVRDLFEDENYSNDFYSEVSEECNKYNIVFKKEDYE